MGSVFANVVPRSAFRSTFLLEYLFLEVLKMLAKKKYAALHNQV